MQGQKGAMGSLPETVDIDCASSSGSTATSHQLCWNNNLRSESETHLASLMLPPPTDSLIDSWKNLPVSSSVECGDPSSSRPDSSMTEWKLGNKLPSSAGFSNGLVQHPENQPEHANTGDFASGGIDTSHLQIQRSNFGWNHPPLSLNGGHSSNKAPIVCPTDREADVSGNSRVMQVEINSGLVGSNAVRLRRVPCKRKYLEGHIGQSSTNPDPHFHQNKSSGESCAVPDSFLSVSGLSLPQQAELRLQQSPVIQGPGTVSSHLPSYGVQGSAEDLGRNSRLRIISPHPMSFSGAVALQNSIASMSQPSVFTPMNHSADSHSLLVSNGVAAHRPLVVSNAPASAYTRHSSASVFSGNLASLANNPSSFGRNTRNNLGYPVFATATGSGPPFQNSVIRRTADGNGAFPGNAVYSSGSRSIPPVLPISQISHRNMVPLDPIHHDQYLQTSSRRLSAENVRQALLASFGFTTGGEGSLASHDRGSPTPARDAMLLTGLVNQGHRRSSSRSSQSMDRHAVNPVGFPISRLAPFRDDRRRRITENFVDTMRRGQGLRLEDIVLLHQSALLRVADLHDRHRDLRLDVDNMSYEELLALEERIGTVSTGLTEETILSRLKQRKLVALANRKGEIEPCCICQEEYTSGEDVGTLDCGHEFHTGCINQWLTRKNLCPICKTIGLAT